MNDSVSIKDFKPLANRFNFLDINNRTILVTGATGHIGSWICKFLAYSKEQGFSLVV